MSLLPLHGGTLRHLYLTYQHDPCRTVTLNIQGIGTPKTLTIACGAFQVEVVGRTFPLPEPREIYQVELTNLEPDTIYTLHVLERKITFRTLPPQSPYRFVEGGDWENSPEAETLASLAGKFAPHAVLLGGDYPSRVYTLDDYEAWDTWLDVYTKHMVTPEGCLIPMVMAIGNHEVLGGFGDTRERAPFFFEYFKQGNTGLSYFSLPIGESITLFVLDSGHTEPHGGPQTDWLEKELQTKTPIKLALYHVPLYPSVRFTEKTLPYRLLYKVVHKWKDPTTANKLFSRESAHGRRHWLPLFERYGLTVAFEHHDQALKRTKLQNGTLYLGDGGWGAEFQYPPLQRFFTRHFAKLIGKKSFFWLVDIDDEAMRFQAISSTGNILDTYTQRLRCN